jgi:hypothetical protein
METDTYPREDVKKFLSDKVCVKVNPGKGKDQKALYESFKVTGVPTLLMITPDGKEIARSGGKPPPEQFVAAFVNPAWNEMVNAEQAKDLKKAVEPAFMLATWYAESEAGKKAQEFVKNHSGDADFKAAYEALEREHQRTTLLNQGNWLLKNGKKADAIEAFKALVEAQPESKEAGTAKAMLKKLGVKLEEPAKK